MRRKSVRLYYFTSARFGLEAIRDQRLKISTVEDLNDPFEWLSITGDQRVRRVLRKARTELGAQLGLICFSSSCRHPLLWAHYADNHKGLCLGFDIKEHNELREVDYIRERMGWSEFRSLTSEEGVRILLSYFSVKFDAWSYESEYRMLVELGNQDPVSGLFFQSFQPHMTLRQVLVGERCDITRQQLDRVLGSEFGGVERFKVRAAFKNFDIVRNLRKSAWK